MKYHYTCFRTADGNVKWYNHFGKWFYTILLLNDLDIPLLTIYPGEIKKKYVNINHFA